MHSRTATRMIPLWLSTFSDTVINKSGLISFRPEIFAFFSRIKGVVAVSVKTDCNTFVGQNKRPRKPRASFRDLRFLKVKLAAPLIHFLTISWQCNFSSGDQILMKLSPE